MCVVVNEYVAYIDIHLHINISIINNTTSMNVNERKRFIPMLLMNYGYLSLYLKSK